MADISAEADGGDGDKGALGQLFDTLREAGSEDEVSVGDLVDAIGSRGPGALLTIPAIFALSPLGAVPGVPTLLALVIGLLAAQILIGKQRVWLPQLLRKRSVKSERVEKALDKMDPVAGFLDRFLSRRLRWAASGPAHRIAAGVVILLCLSAPPLELLPGAVIAPMAAIVLIGLAMLVQDGVVMLVALALSVASIAGVAWAL